MPTLKLIQVPALIPHPGFTLIELMIVIAIIGILTAIAVPAYQNYIIRAQITEGLSLAGGWKAAVGDYHAHNGTFPKCSSPRPTAGSGCMAMAAASTGKYVSAITVVTGGQIKITYGGPQANAKLKTGSNILQITPGTNTHGDVIWVCGKAKVAPSTASGFATDTSSIPAAYLPTNCRA